MFLQSCQFLSSGLPVSVSFFFLHQISSGSSLLFFCFVFLQASFILTVGAGYGRDTLPRQRRSQRVFRARSPASIQTGHTAGEKKAEREGRMCSCGRAGVRDARSCLLCIGLTSMNRPSVRACEWVESIWEIPACLRCCFPFPSQENQQSMRKGI